MNDPMDFNDSQMLHAYLDGELEGAHQDALFGRLSQDSGLRAEMQDLLAIRKAIQHDTVAFTPPAVATSAVFTTLGFSIPATLNAGTAASMAGRAWFAAGSTLLALLTTVMLSMLFPRIEAESMPAATPVQPTAVEQGTQAQAPPPTATPTEHRHARKPAATVPVMAVMLPGIDAAAEPRFEEIATPQPQTAYLDAFDRPVERDLRGIRAPFIPYNRFLTVENLPFTLYVRRSTLSADPTVSIPSRKNASLDMNLGALYEIGKHHAVGIEFGYESFAQSFNGTLGRTIVRYEQQPSAYCLMAMYQLTGPETLPYTYPFVRMQAGAALQLGPLARGTVGVAFKPFERVSLVVGLEGSMLAYRFQGNWFDTKKLGATYGLEYAF